VLAAAVALTAAPADASGGSLTVRVRDTRGGRVLRHHALRVAVHGHAGDQVEVAATLARLVGKRVHHVRLVKRTAVTIDPNGSETASLAITHAGAKALRALLATCQTASVRVTARDGALTASQTAGLGPKRGCGGRPKPRPHATPAQFLVGAATLSFTPPLHDAIANDPAEACASAAQLSVYNGPRPFAYMEPYQDTTHQDLSDPTNPGGLVGPNGHYDYGEPYLDCNHNGRWDGNFIGGGGGGTRYATKEADPVTARAIVVTSRTHTVAVEVVDQEGLFNTYMQQIRDRVRADGVPLGDNQMFLSSSHDESAPQSLGLNGANDETSATNDYWLYDEFIPQAAKTIEQAYARRRPATIRYAESQEPPNFRQCWSSYPYVDDMRVPVLQAVGTNGKVIATLANVSQHTETLGFNPSTLPDWRWYSADWPYFFRRSLERQYGGVAIEMAGSVGSVESPEVFPGEIPVFPQKFIDEDHPAGCRTLFETKLKHAPLGYHNETQAYGEELASTIVRTLRTSSHPSISGAVSGAHADICVEVTNKLFAAAAAAGVFAHRSSYTDNCTVELPPNPITGSTSGTEAKGNVAVFRIGDGTFASVPGEVFPFTFLRSFMGPQDMPYPDEPLPPWIIPHMHTPYRFIDGLGDDMLGYIFPSGNGVGVPGERDPSNINPSSDDRFGCHHSDDSEAASSQTANVVGAALVNLLDAGGAKPEPIVQGRYVLPDGSLSRDPLGGPEIKCTTDQVFHFKGRAIGVDVKGFGVIQPARWMNLHGQPQAKPDRNTRGFILASGKRMWLDVFPDVTLP